MKTFKFRITITPAARKGIEGAQSDNPKRVRICVAKIDLSTTMIDFVRAIPLPTRGLERIGAAAFVTDKNGMRVTEDSLLRTLQGIPPVIEVIREFEARNRNELIAWSGQGNPAQNEGCIAYQNGELTHREQEIAFLERGHRYPSLVILPDNTARIQDVTFRGSAPDIWKPSVSANLVVSGQLLVRDGRAIDSYGDVERRQAYCDKRHLIRFPYCRISNPDGTPALDEAGKR